MESESVMDAGKALPGTDSYDYGDNFYDISFCPFVSYACLKLEVSPYKTH